MRHWCTDPRPRPTWGIHSYHTSQACRLQGSRRKHPVEHKGNFRYFKLQKVFEPVVRLIQFTYAHEEGSKNLPAENPKDWGFSSNHALDVFCKLASPVEPWDGDRLEEANPQKRQSGSRVEVHQLENVHSSLSSKDIGCFSYLKAINSSRLYSGLHFESKLQNLLTCVVIGSPMRKRQKQMAAAIFFLWGRSFSGQLSTIPVISDSTLQNSVSMPSTWSDTCFFTLDALNQKHIKEFSMFLGKV